MTRIGQSTLLPSYRAESREQRQEETRRAIIESAVHAFRVQGYSATTMSTVAALARVSPRTLYRHYGSKDALFAATVARGTMNFLDELAANIGDAPLRDAVLTAVRRAHVSIGKEHREMMKLATAHEEVWQYFLGATSRMQPKLAATLRRAADPSDRTPLTSVGEQLLWEVRASALLGAITTAYRRWATTPRSKLEDLVADAMDTVMPCLG
jgi:AcrR family transcriptional regulator